VTSGDRLRWSLIGLVLLVEAAITALILVPRVDPQYRAFFIDRSTDCWPLPVSGQYRLGDTLSFVRPASPGVAALKVCGWTDADDSGTWSIGNDARLRFHVPLAVAGDLRLTLDMLPFVAGPLTEQAVTLRVNGSEIETVQLGGASRGKKFFRIPRALVEASWGTVDLRFILPDATAPVAVGVNNDRRRLGIRLISLRLSPVPPLEDG
jgi:hypothetical protein